MNSYISEAACSIEPRFIEHPVEGKVAGVRVRGVVDVLDSPMVV